MISFGVRAGAEGEAQFDELDANIRQSEWIVVGAGYHRQDEYGRLRTLLGGPYTGVANGECDNSNEIYANRPELKYYREDNREGGSQFNAARQAADKLLEIRGGRFFTRAYVDRSVINHSRYDQYIPGKQYNDRTEQWEHIPMHDHVSPNSYQIQLLRRILEPGSIVCVYGVPSDVIQRDYRERLQDPVQREGEEGAAYSQRWHELHQKPISVYFGVDLRQRMEEIQAEHMLQTKAHSDDTFITVYDASDEKSHIKWDNRFNQEQNSPMSWIMGCPPVGRTSKVGVMIAGNAMRIGGACVQKTWNGNKWQNWKFCPHLYADTQEESVISFLRELVNPRARRLFDTTLLQLADKYYPGDPQIQRHGNSKIYTAHSYKVKVPTKSGATDYVDVRKSHHTAPYKREANMEIKASDRLDPSLPTLYISFVAAPNCNTDMSASRHTYKRNEWPADTMHRSYALCAVRDIVVFLSFRQGIIVSRPLQLD